MLENKSKKAKNGTTLIMIFGITYTNLFENAIDFYF